MENIETRISDQSQLKDCNYNLIWRNNATGKEDVIMGISFVEDSPNLDCVLGLDEELENDPRNILKTHLFVRDIGKAIVDDGNEVISFSEFAAKQRGVSSDQDLPAEGG